MIKKMAAPASVPVSPTFDKELFKRSVLYNIKTRSEEHTSELQSQR